MVSAPWSHAAIREAVKRVGSYDIQSATTKTEQQSVKKRFEAEYNSMAKAMANGQVLLESDQMHNHDKFIERSMIDNGKQALEKLTKDAGIDTAKFEGVKADDALAQMKERLRNRK